MIKKISKIKNFGIFQNFIWSGLDDFKSKNLIYGWNYSGKTTLSKLFQILEFKDANKYFKDSEYTIEFKQGEESKTVNEQNIETFPFQVKVFNTEYIQRIFTWNDPVSDIEPISFYLGDPAGNIKIDIEKLERRNSRLNNVKYNRYKKTIDDFKTYNKQNGRFSEKAKEIREEYLPRLLQQHEFNKSHFEKTTNSVKSDLSKHILSNSEKSKYRQEALSDKEFEPQLEKLRFSENLNSLTAEVKRILEDTAPKSISFPELETNKALFDWVQTGIALHENATNCKFCTKKLPQDRIRNLNAYYSTKLQEIQEAIEEVKKRIKEEKELIKVEFPNESKLTKIYRSNYLKGIQAYKDTLKEYKAQLSILESDLKEKEGQIFNSVRASTVEQVSFREVFNTIEDIIKQHNKWLSEFDERKRKATEKILNHYVAEYLQNENYLQKEKECNYAEAVIEKINIAISSNEATISELKEKLSDRVKGQEELNKSLEILLHRDDIRIEIKNDKFILERSGLPAIDLSEGEKSAIAFSYFLTELRSLRDEAKLNNTIVFIDDPVSSLDNNHIFQVRSLIHTFFSMDDFCQLFISTHNFEFFSVLLDTRLFGTIRKDTKEQNRPLYFIQRSKENKAIVKKLPKSFSSYKSEYVGLFHIIREFYELENKEDFPNILILPNAVRRFLELYTLMKYPCEDVVDVRVKKVFSPDDKPYHNTKLLHWFSHQNQYEKIQRHDDKLLQIESAIEDLLKHIEEHDELHWKGLNGE